MTIVVLDGFTLNPGDLNWDELRSLGACDIFDRTAADQIGTRAGNAEVVLTNKTMLDRAALYQLSRVQYIGVLATGTNVVDLQAARERGVVVTNVPAYSTTSVAQATFALLLELTNAVGQHSQGVRGGRWSQQPDFCYWEQPLIELSGLTIGIIGFGRIGRAVAQVAHAFGMQVIVHAPRPITEPDFVRQVDLDQLFQESDVVSLHCPLTAGTEGLVSRRRLSQMKASAYLLNTSRGLLIDEGALAEALNAERIRGAGLDVLAVEPPSPDNPLFSAKNCVLTPHCAWGTAAARQRLLKTAVSNVRAFMEGRPQNVVN